MEYRLAHFTSRWRAATVDNLDDAIQAVRRHGGNRDVVCPAHDDQHASLSVGVGDDGRILLHCHAGCHPEHVLAAAGMTWTDLTPERNSRPNSPNIVATYDYRDKDNELLYQVCRFAPKDFRQRQPDGKDGWNWSVKGVRKVLYRLPELQGYVVAYIVEGEKDADRLWEIKLPGTCNAGGAGKWRKDYTRQLRDAGVKHVVVLPDNDDAGRQHTQDVARSCCEAGLKVKIVELPDLPDKGDVSDWLAAGHSKDDLVDVARAQSLYVPEDGATPPPIKYRRLSDVTPEPILWLWRGRIARGKPTVIAGDPGLGKSQITASLAAITSTGGRWPVDRSEAERGNVVILSAEDDPGDTIRPRLDAAKADVSKVYVIDSVIDEERERHFSLKRDIERLGDLIHRIGNVRLVIIDPISAYLGGTDSHKNSDIRELLAPLGRLAAKYDAAFVLVSHLNKSGAGHQNALGRVTGSLAFVAAARAVYVVGRAKDDDTRRLFVPAKNNIGSDATGLAYRIEPVTTGNIETSRISWDPEPVEATADEVLGSALDSGPTKQEQAVELLQRFLEDGPKPQEDCIKEGKLYGISERTLRNAKAEAGIKSEKRAFSGRWYWSLRGRKGCKPQGDNLAAFDENRINTTFQGALTSEGSKAANTGDGDILGGDHGPKGATGVSAARGRSTSRACVDTGNSEVI